MWHGPDQDPGGGPESSTHKLAELKDQHEQQQVLIAQLKEMLRKSEASKVTHEKVDEYMNTLSKRSAKVKSHKTEEESSTSRKSIDLPASKKIGLLRQQVEENKARLAERGKNQKGIEDMVTQLRAQLDDSQNSVSQNTSFNLSQIDYKSDYSEQSSAQELYTILLQKEKRVGDLLAKVQKLESNVIDLQENVKEKDSVIDARTRAITLMTDSLSRKGKNTLDALDDTKEQMRKMQENFVTLEGEMKNRQQKLLEDLKQKNYEIADLTESNSKLEQEKRDLLAENQQLKAKETSEIEVLNAKIKELEEQLQSQVTPTESPRESPQRSGKKNKGKKINKASDLQNQLENTKKELTEVSATLIQNESTIKDLKEEINQLKIAESEYKTKMVELEKKPESEPDDVSKLKKQLDESNKNMIKVKAQHKSKLKELNKKIDAFKKISDVNSEVVRLEAENCRLEQKITELEEEKGSLQLKLVDEPAKSQLEEVQDLIRVVEEKDKIIAILEADITKSKNELESLSEKLASLSHLKNAQVSSEMASIRFEEQMDSLEIEKRQLIEANQSVESRLDELQEIINELKREKQEQATKLEQYIQENMELVDKLEKLSAEKVSSAESIEIVEGLTQQEKLELAAYQKNLDLVSENLKASEENLPQADLNESVNELTEETGELLQRIELFTVERREVMDKMEELKQENSALLLKVKEVESNRDVLVETYEQLQTEKEVVDEQLEVLLKEIKTIEDKQSTNLITEALEELASFKQEIENYKSKLEEKESEINDLSVFIRELEEKLKKQELEKTKLSNYNELQENNKDLNQLLEKLQEELETANNSEWQLNRTVQDKDNEIANLIKEKENFSSVVKDLEAEIQQRDKNLQKVSSQLKEQYLELQKKLEQNSSDLTGLKQPFEAKIEELTIKNKEQLEKMKKIAANLKKKTVAYHELEEKFKASEEKRENELSEKETIKEQLQSLQEEIEKLQAHLKEKADQYDQLSNDFNKFKAEKQEQLQSYESQNVELQNIIADLRTKAEKAQDVNLQQELLQTQENIGEQVANSESLFQSKVTELEMIIEEKEEELLKYKERSSKLEEELSYIEERRINLELKAHQLGVQLEEKSVTCEQIARQENELEDRLQQLTAHDNVIEKKWEESMLENQEIKQKLQKSNELNDKLKRKLAQTLEKLKGVNEQQNAFAEVETQNIGLKKQVHNMEHELKNIQGGYERQLEESKNDFDRINADWQSQFDDVLREKNELLIKCEKIEEELKEMREKEASFIEELSEYKIKIDVNEQEKQNYDEEIQTLSVQIAERDRKIDDLSILTQTVEELQHKIANQQNQITEKDRKIEDVNILRQTIEELQNEIANQRKSNSQPQSSNPLTAFFETVSLDHPAVELELDTSKTQLVEAEETISDLKFKLQQLHYEKNEVEDNLIKKLDKTEADKHQLKENLHQLRLQLDNLQTSQENMISVPPSSSFFDNPNSPAFTGFEIASENVEELKEKIEYLQNEKIKLETNFTNKLKQAESEKQELVLQLANLQSVQMPTQEPVFKQVASALSSFFDDPMQSVVTETPKETVHTLEDQIKRLELEKQELRENLSAQYSQAQYEKEQMEQELTRFKFLQPVELPQEATVEPTQLSTFFNDQSSEVDFGLPIQNVEILEELQNVELKAMQTQQMTDNQEARSATPSGNTQEELLKKIKTLEFILYSTEKERDDALLQCHELSNEFTRLVYRNENLSHNQVATLESQIISAKDATDDCSNLQNVEFEPVNQPQFQTEPVQEAVIKPKKAYLCTDDLEEQPKVFSELESQILVDTNNTPQTQQELHNIEFQPASLAFAQQPQPSMSNQDAYLCFGENDDGWGEEAKLEEEHVKNVESSPLAELKRKIQVLETERTQHLDEIKQLQVKSGKLVKKLKEFKAKNEQLTSTKKSDEFFNLDDTIQEELKLQIQTIEKKLKEAQVELEKEKAEKVAIGKRVEVLSSANDRMVEMKEKQDIEMLGWQSNCKDLSAKLEQYEWGDEGFKEKSKVIEVTHKDDASSDLNHRLQELHDTIKDLTLDNEELQTLLEEQRTLRMEAEKTSKASEPQKEDFEFVVNEKNQLSYQLEVEVNTKKQLQDQINELVQHNTTTTEQYHQILKNAEELNVSLSEKDEVIERLNNTCLVLEQEKAQVLDMLRTFESEKGQLIENTQSLEDTQAKIIELTKEKETLFQELQTRNIQIETMRETVNQEVSTLKLQLEEEAQKAHQLIDSNNSLTITIGEKNTEIQRLTEELVAKDLEIGSISTQLAQEWELRVDQRGSDVAESWKLHLETRETEFGQLEELLRIEISELEEKCTVLVNENNELRKNVDAEIRNEVDRISVLQQQINDRQIQINDLSKSLQAKQNDFNNIQQQLVLKDKELGETIAFLQEERQFVEKILQLVPNHDRSSLLDEITSQISIISFKDQEISELRQQLDELAFNFAQLQEQTNHKTEALEQSTTKAEEYRIQLETLKDNHVVLQQTIADHNHTIANLTQLLNQVQNLKEYENENTQNLQRNISEYQQLNDELTNQLEQKSTQLNQLLRQLEELRTARDTELDKVKSLLEEREREYNYTLENVNQESKITLNEELQKVDQLKRRLLDNENHYEELLAAKDSEIEGLHYQLTEQKENYQREEASRINEDVTNKILAKDQEIAALQVTNSEQNQLLDEEQRQLVELRAIIETQVIKIEELKKELFAKSNDFDSLIAEMDINRSNQPIGSIQELSKKVASKADEEEDLSEPVNRAELDLALYMLHQRDVRCEELTVELTQLLEERDTLQLRLSNSIREMEAIARQSNLPIVQNTNESTGAVPKTKAEEEKQANTDQLATKLSELRTVGYKRDKTIVDEQELRRFQASVMQQHRDVASKLPPEAAARLVDASYTLSRDVQSPSKVLLNWLWGRSTPKVNNI